MIVSQATSALKDKLERSSLSYAAIEAELDQAAGALAQEDLGRGLGLLASALQSFPDDQLQGPCGMIATACASRLGQLRAERLEYALLALHAFDCVISRDLPD